MTTQQIAWAMKHDWYYYTGTEMASGVNVVHVWDRHSDGRQYQLHFTNFEALKQWAGY
jgi:hypothetical protein